LQAKLSGWSCRNPFSCSTPQVNILKLQASLVLQTGIEAASQSFLLILWDIPALFVLFGFCPTLLSFANGSPPTFHFRDPVSQSKVSNFDFRFSNPKSGIAACTGNLMWLKPKDIPGSF
jgi:hypothetical protein